MKQHKYDNCMYIIDKDYRVVNFNEPSKNACPNLRIGDKCYEKIGLSQRPCENCPIKVGHTLFYHKLKKSWIVANSSTIEYPEYGDCYVVQHLFNKIENVSNQTLDVETYNLIIKNVVMLQQKTGQKCAFSAFVNLGSPIIYINLDFAKLLGYDSVEELIKEKDGIVNNLIHPDDQMKIMNMYDSIKIPNKIFEMIFQIPKKDGSWVTFVAKNITILSSKNEPLIITVGSDLESYIKNQEKLIKENEELQLKEEMSEVIMNQIPGGYHRCAPLDGFPFLFISPSFEQEVGWSKEEIETIFDNKFSNLVIPEDMNNFTDFTNGIYGNTQMSEVYRIYKKGGGYKWVTDATIFVNQGDHSFYHGVLTDVTNFIERQQKLDRKNQELKQKDFMAKVVLDNMPSGYHRCKPTEGFPFLQIGSHFAEILGWTEEEIKTKFNNKYCNLIWEEDLNIVKNYSDMAKNSGSGNSYDTSIYRMKHKDGTFRWITDATMYVDLGDDSFFQGVIVDITQYVNSTEKAMKEAEESSHAKTEFLTQMSHDIRTPMNAILGFADFALKADNLEVVQKEFLPKLKIAGTHLLMLINDVLEMSRIETRQEIINLEPCDIVGVTESVLSVISLQAQEKGLYLKYEIDVPDRYVYIDEIKFNRVVLNLLSNAVKFTPVGGTISLYLGQEPSKNDIESSYVMRVSDTGIGMSKEFAKKVFEPFERERTSTISRVEGTGLGMTIVKNIIDAVEGTIEVDSTPGKGTTFTVRCDFAVVDPELAQKIEKEKEEQAKKEMTFEQMKDYFKNHRILLVEDNEFNVLIAETILKDADFIVDIARNGQECVEKILNAESSNYYDIILMDIQMPIMNGYEATKIIRQMSDGRANITIIAVTANAFESDKKAALDAGMDGYISKPIVIKELYNVLIEKIIK